MIITIFFALASISLIIFVPIYLKKKNNLYKYKPQEKMSLKKQKKTIKNIWELGDFANSIFWVSNKYVMIIELGSIEYKLMNDEEQDNIDNNLMKISKTFKNQVQFFSTIEKIDTSYKIEEIRNNINKQNNIEYKDESKTYMAEGMSTGMCIGVALGSTVGIFIKNIPICICFGISIGMLVGMGIGATIKKNSNK